MSMLCNNFGITTLHTQHFAPHMIPKNPR